MNKFTYILETEDKDGQMISNKIIDKIHVLSGGDE